jgi:hypothetical protein
LIILILLICQADPSCMNHRTLKLTFALLFFPLAGFAQVWINGMVADSATLAPLPNVNIKVKERNQGTTSDERGYFKIQVADSDTLEFSMVGYFSKKNAVAKVKQAVIIYLTQEAKMLKPVIIDANILIPGLDKMKVKSSWRNPTMDYVQVPGFQGIQTFGPGYVMGGAISRNSKYEKERSKLKQVKIENAKAKGYVEIVNSPEVKDKLMQDHALSEKKYYELLAIFNSLHKDIIYELGDNELTSLIFTFYAQNANKK